MYEWVSWLSVILVYLLQTVEVRVVPSLLSRGSPLIIDNKINREKGTFKPNMNVESSIDQ